MLSGLEYHSDTIIKGSIFSLRRERQEPSDCLNIEPALTCGVIFAYIQHQFSISTYFFKYVIYWKYIKLIGAKILYYIGAISNTKFIKNLYFSLRLLTKHTKETMVSQMKISFR